MARVPLVQEQDHPEFAEVIEKYRSGRRGKLLNVYRMLLNSPALAESWFNHSNAVRWQTTLDGRLREIVIIRMGHLTNSQYVLHKHVRYPVSSLKIRGYLANFDTMCNFRVTLEARNSPNRCSFAGLSRATTEACAKGR